MIQHRSIQVVILSCNAAHQTNILIANVAFNVLFFCGSPSISFHKLKCVVVHLGPEPDMNEETNQKKNKI